MDELRLARRRRLTQQFARARIAKSDDVLLFDAALVAPVTYLDVVHLGALVARQPTAGVRVAGAHLFLVHLDDGGAG